LAEQVGYVELLVNAGGGACLKSVWSRSPTVVAAAHLAEFEAALAATAFTKLPAQDSTADTWVDYPPEQLMEIDAAQGYHFVHRIGGITESGIRDAGVLLEKLAQRSRREACVEVR
jgi:hypothetical protein